MLRLPFDPATDYYGLLGVRTEASAEQIRRAYRRLAKSFHPDLNAGSRVAQARMARINRAKEILLDPAVRAEYDRARQQRRAVAVAAAVAPRNRHVDWSVPAAPNRHDARAAAVAPAAHAAPAARGLDRTTTMMGLLLAPLLLALVLYVVDAVQVASRPLPPQVDVSLAPSPRTNATAVARAAFTMVHGQSPSRYAGLAAYNVTHTFADNSPESQTLRRVGRVLRDAGTSGNVEEWDRAVSILCAMAEQC